MVSNFAFHSLFLFDHMRSNSKSSEPLHRALHLRLAKKLPQTPLSPLPVPTHSGPLTREVLYEKCFRTPAPLVLRAGAKDWDCVKKWSLDFFAENFGSTRFLSFEEQKEISISDLCKSASENGKSSMKFHPLVDFNEALQKDANWNWFRGLEISPSIGRNSNLFISGQGGTLLHAANVCNLFVQVTGRKTWWIYPPSITKWILPRPAPFHWVSDARPEEWDTETVLNRVPHYKFDLYPGDILYNPPFFWHYVYTREPSIALAYKWINLAHCLRVSPLLTLAPFLSRHSPIQSLLANRKTAIGQSRLMKLFYGS